MANLTFSLPNAHKTNRLIGSELFNLDVDGTTVDVVHPLNQRQRASLSGLLAAAGLYGSGSSATPPDHPEPDSFPGPLPMLGADAAFQASRRLRRRLILVPVTTR